MKARRGTGRRAASVMLAAVLLLALLICGTGASAATSVPGLAADTSAKNILALTKAYSPAAGAFLQYEADKGQDITVYYGTGDSLLDGLDTTVHEFCHTYSYDKARDVSGRWDSEIISYGDGTEKLVVYTEAFSSKLMAAEIPEKLRTFRYNDYVGAAAEEAMASVQLGAYGLLQEYAAYYNGFRALVDMEPYLLAKNASSKYWQILCGNCSSDRNAYAEFLFYQLRYLLYAKDRYPEVYQGILANQAYCDAFVTVTQNFEAALREYDRLVDELKGRGYTVDSYGDNVYMYPPDSNYGFSVYQNGDYDTLMTEMAASKYVTMLETVKAHSSVAVPKASVSSVKNTAAGIEISWKKVSGATYYRVYRQKVGSGTWTKLGAVKGTSFTDETALNGVSYRYRLKTKIGGSYGSASAYKTIKRVEGTSLSSVSNESSGIRVRWKAAEKATGYDIYRKTGSGSYKKIARVTDGSKTSYLDKDVSAGKTYSYKIKAVNGSYRSAYSGYRKLIRLKAPAISSLTVTSKGNIKLGWNKVSYAQGYKVYRKTGSGSYKLIGTVDSQTVLTFLDKNTVKGKTYRYYVRAVRGSYRSAASGKVSVTR